MSSERLILEATPKQQAFAEAVFSGAYRYLAYGGAIRGGKSFIVLALLMVLCKVFPGSRWAIVRKDLPTLRRNTIPTIEKLRPAGFMLPLNQSTWSYRCTNGSEILLFPESIKDDPDLDRWKGLEVNGFVLEEANELAEKSWHKSIERAGSWIVQDTERQPPLLVLLTFNPAANWVQRVFYTPFRNGALAAPFFFLPATIEDNPHVSAEFRESLTNLPEQTYRRFVKGEWDALEDPDQLIKGEWVLQAQQRAGTRGERRLGVDVARFGDDKTVRAFVEGNVLTDIQEHDGLSIDRTATMVMQDIQAGPIDADLVRVDGVGLGAGVVDMCHAAGYQVIDVISGATPFETSQTVFQFANLRSQMWWQVRQLFENGDIALEVCPPKLFEDLTAPRYQITADKVIKVESKDDIKKRIGRSTDYGDAFVLAVADLAFTEPLIV